MFDWDKSLCINDVDKQGTIYSNTLMKIMQNFLPNKTIICNDRNLLWMNKAIKHLIEQKN